MYKLVPSLSIPVYLFNFILNLLRIWYWFKIYMLLLENPVKTDQFLSQHRSFSCISTEASEKQCISNLKKTWHKNHVRTRTGLLEMFVKKALLKNSAKLTGKYVCQSLFFNKIIS